MEWSRRELDDTEHRAEVWTDDIVTDDGDPIELVASSLFVIFGENPRIPTTRILYRHFTWCAVGPDVTAVHKRTRISNIHAALHFAATIDYAFLRNTISDAG